MASKFISFLCLIFLVLLLSNRTPAAYAGRPAPVFASEAAPTQIPNQALESNQADNEKTDANCRGVDEEECLIRQTLVAHIDYVYTQKHKP